MILITVASGATRADGQSGTYGPDVHVLIGTNEALLSYEWQGRHRSCECEFRAIRQTDGSYVFDNSDDDDDVPKEPGHFTIDASGLHFMTQGQWSCCGSGVSPPQSILPFTAPPTKCTVSAERAPFYDNPVKLMSRHAYVQRGDVVETIPALSPDGESRNFVIGMFQGKKKSTIGLLRRTDLTCPK